MRIMRQIKKRTPFIVENAEQENAFEQGPPLQASCRIIFRRKEKKKKRLDRDVKVSLSIF
jgi:hypothetical protein